MFDSFRQTLIDLMDRSTPPETRRAGLAQMKDTLVHARMGVEDLRGGVATTRQRLEAELRELETMRRRKAAAAGINDAETVGLAEKYEAQHLERSEVLQRKLEAQEAELAIVERDVTEMTSALKGAAAGISPGVSHERSARAEAEAVLDNGASVASEIDSLRRADARASRDAEADRHLAELKRRMGK